MARAAAVADLAPSGSLRAAINLGNPVLASRDPATGEPRGVSVDLARELGARLGVRVELVVFDAAGKVVDALRTGERFVLVTHEHPDGDALDEMIPHTGFEGGYGEPHEPQPRGVHLRSPDLVPDGQPDR